MESVAQGAFGALLKNSFGQSVSEQKMAYIGSLGSAKRVTHEEFLQMAEENNQKIVSVQGEDNAKKITKIKCLRGVD